MVQTQTQPPLAREAFAPEAGLVYLNHAAAGLVPVATRDRLVELVKGQAERGVLAVAGIEGRLDAIRARVGRFIDAGGNEIAFLRNTGDGANVVARGLDWQPGDEVIFCDNEFGANAYPWLALRENGVVPKLIRTAHERLTPDVLRRTITGRTRVVAVSWVSFTDGYRHDLPALADIAHRHGALLFVDAIQGLGAFPLDVKAAGVDALSCGAAKWLLGIAGVSFLYVDARHFDRLAVRWRGWKDVADIWNFLDYDQPFAPHAGRYEGGTQNFLGITALETSIDLIDAAGTANVAAHVLGLTDELYEGLRRLGAEVRTVRGEGISSGIVTFTLPGRDPVEVGRELGRRGFCVTYRPGGVRVSPHGHNTPGDVAAFLAATGEV